MALSCTEPWVGSPALQKTKQTQNSSKKPQPTCSLYYLKSSVPSFWFLCAWLFLPVRVYVQHGRAWCPQRLSWFWQETHFLSSLQSSKPAPSTPLLGWFWVIALSVLGNKPKASHLAAAQSLDTDMHKCMHRQINITIGGYIRICKHMLRFPGPGTCYMLVS